MDLTELSAYAVMIGSLAIALWAGVWVARNRAVVLKQLIVGGVVEALLVVQLVIAIVGVASGHQLAEPAVFWGYLVVAMLLMPVAAVVAIAERTRWSSVALLVVSFALLVMQYRVLTLWSMEGAGA